MNGARELRRQKLLAVLRDYYPDGTFSEAEIEALADKLVASAEELGASEGDRAIMRGIALGVRLRLEREIRE